jgi:outer membrane protein OmpA-like peptidoglycan-associated protein
MLHSMPTRCPHLVLAAVLLVPACALAQPAQPNPDTQQIIDALKAPSATPRTRSLRNLVVREKASDAAPSGAPAAEAPEPLPAPPAISMAIQFDFDSARLRPQGEAALDKLSAALKSPELAGSRFRIEGHTDAKGAAAYNLKLSQSRADEVRRYLLSQGVAAERVETAGRGALDPADPAHPYAAQNRRVRIVNLDAGGAR